MVAKCCCFLPLDVGALILGVITLITSMVLGIYSIILLGLEHSSPPLGADHLKFLTHLELDTTAVKIVLSLILIVKLLWMMFSVILIVGLRKNRPSYLLGYFSFGVVVAILMQLSGLLVMLNRHWIMALLNFSASILYIHGLLVVYHTYENMLQDRTYMEQRDDEDQLWNPEDEEHNSL